MKVVPSKGHHGNAKTKIILPLEGQPKAYSKTNSASFDIRTDPADASSQKYSLNILRLQGGEDARAILQWVSDLEKVRGGLNLSLRPTKEYEVIQTILQGTPRTTFIKEVEDRAKATKRAEVAAENDPDDKQALEDRSDLSFATWDDINAGVDGVVREMLPKRVLARVKRQVRREMRKPADMKVRDYYNNLVRINESELTILPPGGHTQSFSADELIDIILYGIPRSWHKEMERQGFDPYEANKTPSELIGFLEQIESAEEFDTHSDSNNNKKKPAGKKSNNNGNNSGSKSSNDKPKYYCKKHGENFSHDTEDCKFLNGGDKKHKSNNYQGSNKTWKKSGDESVTVSKKELQAMIASTTKQTIRDLHASEKKRKSSRDSDLDLNLLEGDKDLEGFNYSDMDDLKIEGEVDC